MEGGKWAEKLERQEEPRAPTLAFALFQAAFWAAAGAGGGGINVAALFSAIAARWSSGGTTWDPLTLDVCNADGARRRQSVRAVSVRQAGRAVPGIVRSDRSLRGASAGTPPTSGYCNLICDPSLYAVVFSLSFSLSLSLLLR